MSRILKHQRCNVMLYCHLVVTSMNCNNTAPDKQLECKCPKFPVEIICGQIFGQLDSLKEERLKGRAQTKAIMTLLAPKTTELSSIAC